MWTDNMGKCYWRAAVQQNYCQSGIVTRCCILTGCKGIVLLVHTNCIQTGIGRCLARYRSTHS